MTAELRGRVRQNKPQSSGPKPNQNKPKFTKRTKQTKRTQLDKTDTIGQSGQSGQSGHFDTNQDKPGQTTTKRDKNGHFSHSIPNAPKHSQTHPYARNPDTSTKIRNITIYADMSDLSLLSSSLS